MMDLVSFCILISSLQCLNTLGTYIADETTNPYALDFCTSDYHRLICIGKGS